MISAILIAAATYASAAEADDYRSYVDQARLFLRRGWVADARTLLERASTHPDGRLDSEAWSMLASARYLTGDVPGAKVAAEQAHSHARNEQQLGVAVGLSAWLAQSFGAVRLAGAQPGASTRLDVQPQTPVLDPELRRYLALVQADDARATVLPTELWLPVGEYLINGVPVTIDPDAPSEQSIPVRGRSAAWTQSAMVRARGLVTAPIDSNPGALPVGVGAAIGLRLPIGPLAVEGRATLTTRMAPPTLSGDARGVELGGAGLLSTSLARRGPLTLDLAVGWSAGRLTALSARCDIDGCTPNAADANQRVAAGKHGPLAELAVFALERNTERALGMGLVFSVEHGFAHVLDAEPANAAVGRFQQTSASGGLEVVLAL